MVRINSFGELLCDQRRPTGKVRNRASELIESVEELNYVAGWFLGLSKSFLEVRTARLLVLAGTDRLDKDLMLGQMMGKFQLVVIPGTGHMIQEVGDLVFTSL